jgi:hypothetical protein
LTLSAPFAGIVCALFACGPYGGSNAVNSANMDAAQRYAAQLNRCFAEDISQRVVVAEQNRILTLSGACAALPSMERRDGGSSFVLDNAELLLDPSMTGAKFTPTMVSGRMDGSAAVDVTLRYFRSNGVPYDLVAVLRVAGQ